AGIENARAVQRLLCLCQCRAKQRWGLLFIAAAMVAADRMVVRDRAAEVDHDLVGRLLDLAPSGEGVGELAVGAAERAVREIWRPDRRPAPARDSSRHSADDPRTRSREPGLPNYRRRHRCSALQRDRARDNWWGTTPTATARALPPRLWSCSQKICWRMPGAR